MRNFIFERIRSAIPKLASKDAGWWRSKLKIVILNAPSIIFSIYYVIKRTIFDFAAKVGIYKYNYNIIFIAGMPMSATTWVKFFLGRVPGYFTRYTPMPSSVEVNQNISESAFNHVPHYLRLT